MAEAEAKSLGWQEEVLFFTGDEFYADNLSYIAQARESIDLETYIFNDDEVGHEYEQALLAAHRRGVKVRLLVDGIGSFEWINTRASDLKAEGLNIRVFNPMYLPSSLSDLSHSLNRRNHRKSCVVDKTTAWVGSMNIAKVHSGKYSPEYCWRDTGLRAHGDFAALTEGFEYLWRRSKDPQVMKMWKPKFPEKGVHSQIVHSNYTSYLRRACFNELLERIENAHQKIFITTAYMAPSAKFIKALCRAAKRGVNVQVLLPRVSDIVFMPWIARSYYEELLKSGIKIYEYLPCVLHAKTMIIDDWGKVGSTNLNGRSFRQDYEIDIIISHASVLKQLEEQFFRDINQSDNILSVSEDFKSQMGRLILRTFRNWI